MKEVSIFRMRGGGKGREIQRECFSMGRNSFCINCASEQQEEAGELLLHRLDGRVIYVDHSKTPFQSPLRCGGPGGILVCGNGFPSNWAAMGNKMAFRFHLRLAAHCPGT